MTEPTGDNPPFLNPLKTNLSESPTMPGKIIKNRQVRAGSPEEIQEVMGSAKKGYAVYDLLKEKYGVKVPDFSYEMNDIRDTGFGNLLTYVDRVEGASVDKARLPIESIDKLNSFYRTMAGYYLDIFQNGGDYWGDFRNDQLVYGRRNGEIEDDVYIVDIDASNIGVGNYDTTRKSVSNKRLFEQLSSLAYAVTQAEGNLPKNSRLDLARQEVREKIASIPDTEPHYDLLKHAIELVGMED